MHHNRLLSTRGLQERLFTFAFSGLVYAQIWEDPLIDMEAMNVQPDDHIVAIASGGCNGMSYLTANPAKITLVDLNAHHIALNKLKRLAAVELPDHAAFYRFFGAADTRANIDSYERYLRPKLDETTRRHWDGRDWRGRKRISYFTDNVYRHGLLGMFIAAGHMIARLHGVRLHRLLEAKSLTEQRQLFERELKPIFSMPHIKWLTKRPSSLYGLGIPPAQYEALLSSAKDGGGMASVLEERVERLTCGFNFADNYFAWQAFGRSYKADGSGPVPPYLEKRHFETVRANAGKIDIRHVNFIEFLKEQPNGSIGCYVLLDAQDWMVDDILNRLWSEIMRTAKPGARVIFRTAGDDTILPGRVSNAILDRWDYDAERCREMTLRDRSSIYGGFHLYTLRG
ncbi:MAG: DUF3419 family protein [Beijerinckiaceae bacterium]|nr:DUF3419 family protein [Beijerinckiaceae bacterium]